MKSVSFLTLTLGVALVSPALHADQTQFTGTFNASGIRLGGGCNTPGPFTINGALSAVVQPSLSSLASSGGSASGVYVFSNFTASGCSGGDSPGGGPLSVTVAAGGATTMVLAIPDPTSPCTLTLRGTTTSVSGDAISCIEKVSSGSAPVTLTAQGTTNLSSTLRVSPAALQFTAIAGGGAPPPQILNLLSDAVFQTNITGQWTLMANDRNGPQTFQATFIQTGGNFSGALIDSVSAKVQPITGTAVGSTLTFTVNGDKGDLVVGSGTFNANVTMASGSYMDYSTSRPPDSGTFTLTRSGSGLTPASTLNWTAQAAVVSGAGWLNVQPASGSIAAASGAPSTAAVSVQTSGLAAGQYSGSIAVSAPGAGNSPVAVSVHLTVLAAATPALAMARPQGLIFVASPASPPSQTVQISTVSPAAAQITIFASTIGAAGWLTVDKTSASLGSAAPVTLAVSAATTGLAAGVYRGQVTIAVSSGTTLNVPVVLVVPATSASALSRSSAQAGCTASTLLAVDRTLGTGFQTSASWPTTLEALVVDDCGIFASSALVVATFSNGDSPVALQFVGNGIYQGTWKPALTATSITVTITATQGTLKAATVTLNGLVSANPNVPLIFSGGMVSAASFTGATLPPGAIIAIYGNNLAQAGAGNLPLPTVLGGATFTAAGRDLPLFYTSGGQVNAQLPFELTAGTRVAVVAKTTAGGNSMLSVPEVVTVSPAAPGIFSASSNGKGQGIILDVQNRLLDGKQASATAGQTVVIYCTGLGAVSPAAPSGQASPLNPLSQTIGTPVVVIGGIAAQVAFSGLTPSLVGLYQVNAVVPAGVAGAAVPVTITQLGVTSNTVTMAIQ